MTAPYDEDRCVRACDHVARAIVQPLVLRYYRASNLAVDSKEDWSIVTEADGVIEGEIRAYLDRAFPDFGLIGEELPAVRSDREYIWTIDPLDGTEAFVAGLPLFGTLLSVIRQSVNGERTPVLGAAYLPLRDCLIIGTRRETTVNGTVVRMPELPRPEQRRLVLGDMSVIARSMTEREQHALLGIASRFGAAHTWGECLGYLNMLEGTVHARIEAGLGVDDVAPLEPIVLGAGGALSALDGKSLTQALTELPDLGDSNAAFAIVCAATGELHQELLTALAPCGGIRV